MTKVCRECLYKVPSKEDELEPMEEGAEDCPKCGALGSVVSEEELPEETGEEEE